MTNKELRRRETDKFGPYVQQVALDHANKRITELESALKLATGIALSWINNELDGSDIYRESLEKLRPAIDLLPQNEDKDGEYKICKDCCRKFMPHKLTPNQYICDVCAEYA